MTGVLLNNLNVVRGGPRRSEPNLKPNLTCGTVVVNLLYETWMNMEEHGKTRSKLTTITATVVRAWLVVLNHWGLKLL